jgi:hypothetical protein
LALLLADRFDQLALAHPGGACDAEPGRNGLKLGENHARQSGAFATSGRAFGCWHGVGGVAHAMSFQNVPVVGCDAGGNPCASREALGSGASLGHERPAVPSTGVKGSQLPNSADFMNQVEAQLAGAHEYLCSIKPRSESGMRKTLGIPGVLQP